MGIEKHRTTEKPPMMHLGEMHNRREFIKGSLGLAGIIAAGKAPAALIRSKIASRTILMRESEKLPYDAEVEYLESTGTQYIDTGIYGTQNTIANLRGCNLEFDSYSWGFGSRVGWGNRMFALYNGSDQGFRYVFGWGSSSSSTSPAISQVSSRTGNMADFVIAQQCSVDGQVLPEWSSSSFQTPETLRIFGAYTNGAMNYGKWRFSDVKITVQGGTLVRDFIPVRFTNELGIAEGAMYDKVSKKLFRNQGTGSFKCGRDIKPMSAKKYVQDGLVAMWDGIENAGWGEHDASATSWKDLIGQQELVLNAPYSWEDYYISTDRSTRETYALAYTEAMPFSKEDITTIEVMYDETQSVTWGIHYPLSIVSSNAFDVLLTQYAYDHAHFGNHLSGLPNNQSYSVSGLHHFQMVYDFENPTNSIVINHTSEGDYNVEITNDQGISSGQNGVFLFGRNTRGTASSNGDSGGKFYFLRCYNRKLTRDELASNYAIDKARFGLP